MWRMGSVIAASIDRLATSRPRGTVGYLGALAVIGAAILLIELYLAELDHGTHLLVGVVLVIGTALCFGPGPAASGMVLGAGTSVAVSATMTEGTLVSPDTYVQLAVFVTAGGAAIALASIAIRSRTASSRPGFAASAGAPAASLAEPLTDREAEILRLAASGIAVGEIADRLCLSQNTVKTHLTHVYAKLGVRGRPDAIRAALHFGCLTPTDICPHRFPREERESPLPVIDDHRKR
jgi:DNA-binding CsgD family transcriptional regulator